MKKNKFKCKVDLLVKFSLLRLYRYLFNCIISDTCHSSAAVRNCVYWFIGRGIKCNLGALNGNIAVYICDKLCYKIFQFNEAYDKSHLSGGIDYRFQKMQTYRINSKPNGLPSQQKEVDCNKIYQRWNNNAEVGHMPCIHEMHQFFQNSGSQHVERSSGCGVRKNEEGVDRHQLSYK